MNGGQMEKGPRESEGTLFHYRSSIALELVAQREFHYAGLGQGPGILA